MSSPEATTAMVEKMALEHNTSPDAILRSLQLIANDEMHYTQPPVGGREFVESPYYLNAGGSLYPKVMEVLVDIYDTGPHKEILLTGGIGSAKTTLAVYIQAYETYKLLCYSNPHAVFGLDPTSEIEIIFQSINAGLARDVDYKRFKSLIDASPFFVGPYGYNRRIESEMRFPHRIIVKPAVGTATAAIGQNVIGGVLDEVNFMEIISNSAKATDGGVYDQAAALYSAIVRRRESRFMQGGNIPGQLCLVSSKRYPGEFTELKIQEAKDPARRIYVYDKRVWDIKPEGTYTGETFHVYTGDEGHKPQIVDEGDLEGHDEGAVVEVPVEYRQAFEDDILNALRDIAGVSTLALHPFMINVERVKSCFGLRNAILSLDECDMKHTRPVLWKNRIMDIHQPRYVHIDLGVTGDAAGVACGYVDKFVPVDRGAGVVEMLPHICYDFILRIVPPRNGEIQFSEIREMIYKVRDAGVPIRWVTLDSFQSVDTIQILRTQGFITGMRSVDKTSVPYDMTKTAFYDQRIAAPEHTVARRELLSLERVPKTNKIDHPPHGSKDCADAMAGVAHGLTMLRAIWVMHKVSLSTVPVSITSAMSKNTMEQ